MMAPPTFHACPKCGGKTSRGVADYGKTPGDEGHDLVVYQVCPEHGVVAPVDSPVPCYICGTPSEIGVIGCEIIPEYGDYIPGLPSVVGLCDSPDCAGKLRAIADENLDAYGCED